MQKTKFNIFFEVLPDSNFSIQNQYKSIQNKRKSITNSILSQIISKS